MLNQATAWLFFDLKIHDVSFGMLSGVYDIISFRNYKIQINKYCMKSVSMQLRQVLSGICTVGYELSIIYTVDKDVLLNRHCDAIPSDPTLCFIKYE